MGFVHELKKIAFVRNIVINLQNVFFSGLSLISPELNSRARYWQVFHKKLNLEKPSTLNEKLIWLKLRKYITDPLVAQCADKYRVREYIKECGYADILVKLLHVYDRAEDIDWKSLPESFVLKWNFGAGFNVICPDKALLDQQEAVRKLSKWGKNKYWLPYSEMHYKKIPKKIVCEEFLRDSKEKVIPDYKVYCFHGKPMAILVMHDRGEEIKAEFFDRNWNKLKNSGKYKEPVKVTERPKSLNRMMAVSEKLSAPFPFVRCDYYEVNGQLYFGELTFTSAGGLFTSETQIEGKYMTDFIHLDGNC